LLARVGEGVARKTNAAKAWAEATFQKKEDQRREGDNARAEYESEARARDENTARLRALRLAKEAADREAGIEVAPKEKAKPVRNPRSNLRQRAGPAALLIGRPRQPRSRGRILAGPRRRIQRAVPPQ
jgi:hypothetical protein